MIAEQGTRPALQRSCPAAALSPWERLKFNLNRCQRGRQTAVRGGRAGLNAACGERLWRMTAPRAAGLPSNLGTASGVRPGAGGAAHADEAGGPGTRQGNRAEADEDNAERSMEVGQLTGDGGG